MSTETWGARTDRCMDFGGPYAAQGPTWLGSISLVLQRNLAFPHSESVELIW